MNFQKKEKKIFWKLNLRNKNQNSFFLQWPESDIKNSKSTITINLLGRYLFLPSSGWLFLSRTFGNDLFYRHVRHRNTNCHSARSCGNFGNCQQTFSGISLRKKKQTKKDKEREQKHFIVLYIWKYMSEYWKKKMYMLTNLWQNILCKAQYLKLQYFWFLKQGQKKKHIRRTSKHSPCIASGPGSDRSPTPAGSALLTCNELQKTVWLYDRKWTCTVRILPNTDVYWGLLESRRKRRLWRQSSGDTTAGEKSASCSDPAAKQTLCFTPFFYFWRLDFVQDRKLLYTEGLDCFSLFLRFCCVSPLRLPFVFISLQTSSHENSLLSCLVLML